MYPEVTRLLYFHVEQTVILNEITQDRNEALEEEIRKNVEFNRLENIVEETMDKSQSVVKVDQWTGGPQKNHPLEEDKLLPRCQKNN